jgi:hypothetical protein
MFFADPVAAFKFRRALKPASRLVFLCWRTPPENPWGLVPLRAAQPFLPTMPRPGPDDPGQYSFGDRARVERILKEAGFATPAFQPIDRPVVLGKDMADILDNTGRFGPLARAFADAEPAAIDKAKAAIAAALEPHLGPDGVACRSLLAGERGPRLMEHRPALLLPPVTLVLAARSARARMPRSW